MHGNNDKKSNWGPQPDGTWIPSDRYDKIDINKYRLEPRQRESDKSNTQLGSSSSTSASNSKGQGKK